MLKNIAVSRSQHSAFLNMLKALLRGPQPTAAPTSCECKILVNNGTCQHRHNVAGGACNCTRLRAPSRHAAGAHFDERPHCCGLAVHKALHDPLRAAVELRLGPRRPCGGGSRTTAWKETFIELTMLVLELLSIIGWRYLCGAVCRVSETGVHRDLIGRRVHAYLSRPAPPTHARART